ncbi:MAG: 3-isopropylmalate dehydratase [Acidimicrobiaceae bacterium]|nr:3-isopropylmalate dehydratase [Acidimicrobiaceae bacterium]
MPGRYLVSIDPVELAEHVFEPLGPEVQARVRNSPVIVAGFNFGCGSAREQAASGLVGAGVVAVVAKSFARTFFRNAINTGLLAITQADASDAAADGVEVFVDLVNAVVVVGDSTYPFPAYPESLIEIIRAGGLIPYVSQKLSDGGVA